MKVKLSIAIAAVLSVLLALGVCLALSPVSNAAAASSISINSPTTHGDATEKYLAIKLFDADIYQGKASNISYAFNENSLQGAANAAVYVESGIKNAIAAAASLDNSAIASWTAEQTAEYISENMQSGPLNGNSFGYRFAKEIYYGISGNSQTDTFDIYPDGSPVTVDGPGYYLVVPTRHVDDRTDTASSSPVFILVGSGNTEINPKSAIPSLALEVKNSSTGEYGASASATYGESVDYRAIATLPDNYDSYPIYSMIISINNSGSDTEYPEEDSIVVKVDDVALPASAYKVDFPSKTYLPEAFSLEISDLKALDVPVTTSSNIVVEFSAPKSDNAASAVDAVLQYSADPLEPEDVHAITTTQQVDVYSYSLTLRKVDNTTGKAITGGGRNTANFMVQTSDGSYVVPGKSWTYAHDVEVVSDPRYFNTDTKTGEVVMNGLAAGTYTITEVAPPEGYKKLSASFKVKIDASGAVASISVLDSPALVSVTSDAVEVRNMKLIELPTTGEEGIYLFTAAGVLVLVGTLAAARRRNKKGDEE